MIQLRTNNEYNIKTNYAKKYPKLLNRRMLTSFKFKSDNGYKVFKSKQYDINKSIDNLNEELKTEIEERK